MRKTQKTIILLTSGSLFEQVSAAIQDPVFPLRRPKILDHVVFCGWLQKYEPLILKNTLSLAPRAKKLSDDFNKLEGMILASIKEIERLKVIDE